MHKSLGMVAIAFGTLLMMSCDSASTPSKAEASPAPVPSATVPSNTASHDFIASGPVVVENQVDLAAQRDGIVAEVLVDTGVNVRKGQLLGKLDDRQLTADRDAAAAKARSIEADARNWEAGEKMAQSDLNRADAMWQAGVVTKEEAEHAKYKFQAAQFEVERQKEDLKNAQAMLRSLDLELEKTRITAPFSGVVARRYVRAGQQVAQNDRLFWISGAGPLRVKFTLPESYVGRIKKGTKLTVVPSGATDEVHRAHVMLVSPVVDPASDTIDVTAELEGPAASLRPGMTANIRLPDAR